MEYLQYVVYTILGVALTSLSGFLIDFLHTKAENIKATQQNELVDKYLTKLENLIDECVIATNQTYVDNLKQENVFDADAQGEAFSRTYEAVMGLITEEGEKILSEAVNDIPFLVQNLIEASVNKNKQ